MPPMAEAWRRGLAGVEAEAGRRHGRAFADLDAEGQDAVLLGGGKRRRSTPPASMASRRTHFFRHVLLKTVVGVYYSHPKAWSEIGFGGPASPRGYVRLGLDERDRWEAPLALASGETRP